MFVREGVRRGLVVVSHDHVGHGNSQGERVQVDSMDEYIRPVITHVQRVKEEFPGKPIFIIGHSLGGEILLVGEIVGY